MKWYFWVIIIVVILLVIGYNTNWFGMKKPSISATNSRLSFIKSNDWHLACGKDCTLTQAKPGESSTNGYNCKCWNGFIEQPSIVKD